VQPFLPPVPTDAAPIRVGSRLVGPGHPCLVIAEVGMAHDGSLGTAHAFVDAIARTGADAVKFQTHLPEAESTAAEPFRVAFSRQDATRYEYWRRTGFSPEGWRGLAEHAADAGLLFLSSPFSIEALELLAPLGVPAWKIASGEVGNLPLLRRAAATGRPVLLSSGMSGYRELAGSVDAVRDAGGDVALFQCTSAYPCPPERLGLRELAVLAARFSCPVGLSDHSGTTHAGLAAATLGASMIEVHVTLSREAFGPDVVASLTTTELRALVDGIRFVERAALPSPDKDEVEAAMRGMRLLFTKSIVASRSLPAGQRLGADDLALKKPGTGLPAAALDALVGRRLLRGLAVDEQVQPGDVEPELVWNDGVGA
jgi:N,N'-diacetyllegionaminate synthase